MSFKEELLAKEVFFKALILEARVFVNAGESLLFINEQLLRAFAVKLE